MDSLVKLIGTALVVLLALFAVSCSVFTVDANEIVVKQDAIDGNLTVYTSAGTRWQGFGHITRYQKSAQFWFQAPKSNPKDDSEKVDNSIKVRFNDGGHGNISGSLRYDLPQDPEHMIRLHSKFGSMAAIDHQLVQQVVAKSVYMTGPMMSSRESYSEKRNDLITFFTDQILDGVYRTERQTAKIVDPVSGQEKTVDIVKPIPDPKAPGGIAREELSPFTEFGMRGYNVTVNSIDYDNAVEDQIKNQQAAFNAVQQAMVDARKAEQKAITAKAEGEAEAAKAKWAQEVQKATAVTQAEQQRDVAKLALETTQLTKQATIAEAEGQAKAKQLATQANNNLEQKLDAYIQVNKAYADAMSKQAWVPQVQMGASGGGVNGNQLMELLQVKTAKELALNLSPTGGK